MSPSYQEARSKIVKSEILNFLESMSVAVTVNVYPGRSPAVYILWDMCQQSEYLQRSELACKQYKKWLHALAGHSQAVVTGRATVRTAQAGVAQYEEALELFLRECHDFLSSQKKPKRRHSER